VSAAPPSTPAETAVRAGLSRARGPRRRLVVVATVAVLALAGLVAVVVGLLTGGSSNAGSVDNGSSTALATVTRRPLSSQTEVSATLGYAGSYNVVNQARGTITWLPSVGRLVREGQTLYKINGKRIILLYGSIPAYRNLAKGMDGADVRQLNADLVALGYATPAELDPGSDVFGWWTKAALERLQADLGVAETGRITLGQVVFLPRAARITRVMATLGVQAGPGVIMQASSTARRVTVALDAAQQAEVKVGDRVMITLPGGQRTPGRVSSVGTVATAPASSSGSPTVEVEIVPTNPAATGRIDQAPVQVAITTARVRSALVVPVNALLASAGGGYALEVAGADDHRRPIAVSLGLFDDADGLVQVSGPGLKAGLRVVVPST
jgi:putative peptidoglycan binding protein